MKLNFLPSRYLSAISNIDENYIYEIRLRLGFPVIVNFNLTRKYLTNNNLSLDKNKTIICNENDIKHIINEITEQSVYAFTDKIKNGYITTKDGVRVGISGECVFDNDNIRTIKNFSSLLIRVPHEIFGSAEEVFNRIKSKDFVDSSLIFSPPFLGKTTILKDLARIIDQKFDKSILIIDERGEFSSVKGENIDKIKFSSKSYAFNYAIRSLAPSLIITDELVGSEDYNFVLNAVNSGVKVIASCHSDSIQSLSKKQGFIKGVFDRLVLLGNNGNIGKIKAVYNGDFIEL